MATSISANILPELQRSARRGIEFLLQHMNPDGSIGPIHEPLYYYRVPWAFALMGEIGAGQRLLDWIANHMLTPDGAFEGTITPLGDFSWRWGSYPLACLLVGSTLLQRHDITYRGIRRLLQWQDPVTGGIYHQWHQRTASGECEIFPTAQAGMTFLLTGQLEAARHAGEWFQIVRDLQPDWEHQLYAVHRRDIGLVTDFPPEKATLYVTRKDHPWQHHFNGGIAAAFLAQLYMATGEPRWLELAREYQYFIMSSEECIWESMQTCKAGWGSGLLYVITREQKYREWSMRMAQWFISHQFEDGHWENTKYWTPHPTLADNIHITAEFTMHVAHLISYLSI